MQTQSGECDEPRLSAHRPLVASPKWGGPEGGKGHMEGKLLVAS